MYSPEGYQEKENKNQMFNSHVGWFNSHGRSMSTTNNINHLKESTSTRQFTQAKSEQNLHILKLQSRALEQLRKLQHQKFQIYTLTQQTQQLMKQCDSQKSYIKSVNIDMMRQQYEQQLKFLSQQRNKLINLVTTIKNQHSLMNEQHQERINSSRLDNLLLSQKIELALVKKQQLMKHKHQNSLIKDDYLKKLAQQEDKLDELRHVQRKVAISLKEIQRLRKEYLQS